MSTITSQFVAPDNIPRISFSFIGAIALTFALLLLMQQLISNNLVAPEPEPDIKVADIIFPEPPTITTQHKKLEPPAPVTEPPPVITHPPTVATELTTHIDPVIIGPASTETHGSDIQFNSSVLVKQVMVPPHYPRRAAQRGIEGYVDIQFVVTGSGSTRDIKILAAEPAGVFENSAIKAVEHWRYRPRIVDGVGVDSDPIAERIRFTLDD